MARKKIVFVIVEGPSDDTALGAIFSQYFNPNEVRVEVMHTDITTKTGHSSTNILSKIADVIKAYAQPYKLNARDFLQVIHIVDTDGAYVPDSHVVQDNSVASTYYTPEYIFAKDPRRIMARNKQKQDILDKLVSTKCVWNIIPYQVFYMSCNLDHVLHNKMNPTDQEKETDSHNFAMRYHIDIRGFIDFISTSTFSVTDSYTSSWKFIKEHLNSLQRYTNLGLCFDKNSYEEQSST